MGLYLYRLLGAATFDATMYEGIESDRGTNLQAAATVVLASLAVGVGASGWLGPPVGALAAVGILACLSWLGWAVLIFHVGTRVLPVRETRVTVGELLRTTGFAAAPGLLHVFAVLPGLAGLVSLITFAWISATMVVAVQHALDYPTPWRAIAACLIALMLLLMLAAILGVLWGPSLS